MASATQPHSTLGLESGARIGAPVRQFTLNPRQEPGWIRVWSRGWVRLWIRDGFHPTLILVLVLSASASLAAAPLLASSPPPPAQQLPPRLTADQAAALAQRQTGGYVLSIRPGRGGYQVRILNLRGRAEEVWIPAPGR